LNSSLRFNISHSGEWVVVAVGVAEVGIDIEEMRLKEIKPALLKKVLSDSEQGYFSALAEEEKVREFYRFWTMKEAYAKCLGLGLGLELKGIEIGEGIANYQGERQGAVQIVEFCEGYSLAICTFDKTPFILYNNKMKEIQIGE
jgi:4'-phosphopantetheinyl transferase